MLFRVLPWLGTGDPEKDRAQRRHCQRWRSLFIQRNVSTFTGMTMFTLHWSVFNFDYCEYLSKMNLNTRLISVVSL